MGRAATCPVDVTPAPGAAALTHPSVSVLLETDELVLRLTPRTIVPRADVTSPTVDGEALVFGQLPAHGERIAEIAVLCWQQSSPEHHAVGCGVAAGHAVREATRRRAGAEG